MPYRHVRLKETPSQTAGPYVHIGLTPSLAVPGGINVRDLGTGPVSGTGTPIVVAGRIFDGAGAPVGDAIVELWQADADGLYTNAWARAACEDSGAYRFDTIKPGRVLGSDGRLMAPHITLWIVARGINIGLHTRLYFEDEAEANATDFVLSRIPDPSRRGRLIANKSESVGRTVYTLDIHLQGDGETVFFVSETRWPSS